MAEMVSLGISCALLRVIILLVLGNWVSMFHLFFLGEVGNDSGLVLRGLPHFLVSINFWSGSLVGTAEGVSVTLSLCASFSG